MSDKPPEVPDWLGYTVIAMFAAGILAMFMASSSYGPVRIAGLVIFLGILAWLIIGDLWVTETTSSDPRNITHTDSGKTVIATADFSVESGVNRGKVDLAGELWDATCDGEHAPRKGDELLVVRRDGLRLVVSPRERSNTIDPAAQ